MTRWWRLLAAIGILSLGIGVGAAPAVEAQTPSSTGAPETPDGGPAIDDLVGCVAASRQLAVLFLIDESASLKASDPDDGRVDAAQSALDSLIALATGEGRSSPTVDVAFSAFSNEYRPIQPWTRASAASAGRLRTSLARFAKFNSGMDTDFVNALNGANDSLADRSAQVTESGGAPPCRAILLFTDGTFDLGVRETAAQEERFGTTKPYAPDLELTTEGDVREAERLGRAALCDADGVADQLRDNEVTMLTVALSGKVSRTAQIPLAAATTGEADGHTCGTPGDRPTGAYLPASGVDVLVARFSEVGTRLAGGNPLPGTAEWPVCAKAGCDEGSRTFQLDQGLRRVQVLALAPEAGAVVHLEDPGGDSVDVSEAGTTSIGATPITARAIAGRGLVIDIVRPGEPEAWDGVWKVSVVDPDGAAKAKATIEVFVFSDLTLEISRLEPWFRGEATDVTISLAAPKGVDVKALVTKADVELTVRNPITGDTVDVALEGPPTGPYKGTYEVPADLTANGVEVSASARLTTASQAELLSQSAPREVLVQRPKGSIQILPPSLKMPSLTGEGSTRSDLILQPGSAKGCVWFGDVEVPTAPDGAAPIELTIDGKPLPKEGDCIEVPEGGPLTITLEASPDARASGTVRGWMQVFEKVEGREAPSTTQLQFRFDLARGVDEARRLLLAVLLVAGGLALPMAALLVINSLTARFQTLDVVRGAALPVRVAQGSIFRVDGNAMRTFALRGSDFDSLAGLGTTRSFAFGGVRFRAMASRNPFGATIAMAAPEGGAEKLKGHAGSRVELDPGLSGSWVFLLDSNKTRRAPRGDAEGLLIAFVAEGDTTTQTQKLLRDIQSRLPKVAENLSTLLRSATPKSKPKATPPTAPPEAGPTVDASPVDDVDEPDQPDALIDEPELRPDDAPEDLEGHDHEPPMSSPPGFTGGPR